MQRRIDASYREFCKLDSALDDYYPIEQR